MMFLLALFSGRGEYVQALKRKHQPIEARTMTTTKKNYFLSKKLREEAHYNAKGRREGVTRIFYRNGKLKKELLYKNGKKEGPARRFFKDGTRFEYECNDGREKTGIWKNYNENDLLVMERAYTTTNDLLYEVYYEYGEYGRIATIQWTKFLDDEVEKYKQKASEYDKRGNPGFPVSERNKYSPVDSLSYF
jgi:antitoxin component YwqK of YwqJK toxin-antitoxin module